VPNSEIYSSQGAFSFAAEHNIPIDADLDRNFAWLPRLTVSDRQIGDADTTLWYSAFQLDYLIGGTNLQARRKIVKIQPGNHTELNYWTPTAPTKELSVHQGLGELVVARLDDTRTWLVNSTRLDATHPITVPLPPDSFYRLQAAENSPAPLIVSGFYEAASISRRSLEIAIDPDQREVVTADGSAPVPHALNVAIDA
jgi:hypothetical protein